MNSELIVSVYNEDTSWIMDAINTNKLTKIVVYNKGYDYLNFNDDRIQVIERENIGREGETFLHHIIHNWYNLPENIIELFNKMAVNLSS